MPDLDRTNHCSGFHEGGKVPTNPFTRRQLCKDSIGADTRALPLRSDDGSQFADVLEIDDGTRTDRAVAELDEEVRSSGQRSDSAIGCREKLERVVQGAWALVIESAHLNSLSVALCRPVRFGRSSVVGIYG